MDNVQSQKNKLDEMLKTTLSKIREMTDADTIVGKPVTTPEGVTVIPVSKMTYGFGAGGSDYTSRHASNKIMFGGGGGAGIDITPVSFIVISGDKVEVLPASGTVSPAAPAAGFVSTIDKLADVLPGVFEKAEEFINKQKAKKAAKDAEKQEINVDKTEE